MLRSVRSKLLAWVLIPLVGAVALNAVATYRDAVHTATVVQDRLLLGSARNMGEQIRYEDGAFHYQILPSALELFQSTQPDRIFYRITTGEGQLLAGYTDLQSPLTPKLFHVSPCPCTRQRSPGTLRASVVRTGRRTAIL